MGQKQYDITEGVVNINATIKDFKEEGGKLSAGLW